MNTLVPIFVLGLAQRAPADATRLPEHCPQSTDQSVLASTPPLTRASEHLYGLCSGHQNDSHVTSILQLIRVLQWHHINIIFDQNHSHDLQLLLPDLGLTSIYDLGDLQSSVEVKQVLQWLHKKYFPKIHILILSNYTRALKLLQMADHFDLASNRTTDYRHYSYWIVACYSPCQPSLFSQIYHLENVAVISSQRVGCPVLNQLIKTSGGGNPSAGQCVNGFRHKQDIFPNTRYGLNNRTLIVSTIPRKPFVMKTENGFEGYLIDALDSIASTLNFSYLIVHPAGMSYGEIVDDRWDGLVGQLERRDIDLAVADLTIHEDREKVMDFLYPPIFTSTEDVMYRIELKQRESWQILLKPFSSLSLTILSVTLVISTLMGYMLFKWDAANTGTERNTDPWKSRMCIMADTFFYMFGTLTCRGLTSNPRSQSTRLLLFTWGVFSVIIATCYIASLVAILAIEKPTLPFTNLGELVRQKEYKFGFRSGTIQKHIFSHSKSGDIKLAWERILEYNKTDPEVLSGNWSVHFAKVKTENYAFVSYRFIMERIKNQDCNIRLLGQDIIWHQIGIGVPTDYPLSGEIEALLAAIVDSGLPDIWWRWWSKTKEDKCIKNRKVNTLILQDIVSVFYLPCIGLAVSLIVLVIEVIKHKT